MSLRAVLFDMGDTLIQREERDVDAHSRRLNDALLATLAQACPGVALPDAAAFDALVSDLFRRHAPVYSREALLTHLAAHTGWPIAEPYDPLISAWHALHEVTARSEADVRQMLEILRDRGLRLGVISNTTWRAPWRDRELAAIGVLDLFPIRIYSSDLGVEKPDPRIFAAALAALGDVPPDQAMYVGNDLHDDIAGAHGAGLWTAWLPPRGVTAAPPDHAPSPDLVLTTLAELPARLAAGFTP
ncbi:MAG TPA: HAD family hydrolase, partial [Chloroflexia bacterium]|nr:HAD family hydrolase [Chloroflexia bacterium]